MPTKVIYNGYDRPIDFTGSDREKKLLSFLRDNGVNPEDVPVESVIEINSEGLLELPHFARHDDGSKMLGANGAEFKRYTARYPIIVEWNG